MISIKSNFTVNESNLHFHLVNSFLKARKILDGGDKKVSSFAKYREPPRYLRYVRKKRRLKIHARYKVISISFPYSIINATLSNYRVVFVRVIDKRRLKLNFIVRSWLYRVPGVGINVSWLATRTVLARGNIPADSWIKN